MSPRPRATLVYNPKAGRRRHAKTVDEIRTALSPAYEIVTRSTEAKGHATRLSREAALEGASAVFAWGGDGTIREVAEGLHGTPCALGVLPGGTFNVVALAVGLPRGNAVLAAHLLADARPEPRDVGLIGDTPFLMQATAGFDGYLMQALRPELKKRFGMAGPVLDAMRALARYTFPEFTVDVDGVRRAVTGAGFTNMAEYAGPFKYVPGARWDDGQGHVLLYSGRSRLAALRFALNIGLGRHHLSRDVEVLPADSFVIHGCPGVYVQTDGDVWAGALPAACRISPRKLQVLVPRKGA